MGAPEQPPPVTWLRTFDGVPHAAIGWSPGRGKETRWTPICLGVWEGVTERGECRRCRRLADELLKPG